MSDDSEDTLPDRSGTSSRLTFADLAGSVRALPEHEHKDLDEIIAEIDEDYADELVRRFLEEEMDVETDIGLDDGR